MCRASGGRSVCTNSWAVPEMSLPACASLVVATAHRAGDHTGKGRPPAGPLDRAVLRNSGKKLLGGIEGGLVNDGLMGALRIVLGQLTPVRNSSFFSRWLFRYCFCRSALPRYFSLDSISRIRMEFHFPPRTPVNPRRFRSMARLVRDAPSKALRNTSRTTAPPFPGQRPRGLFQFCTRTGSAG